MYEANNTRAYVLIDTQPGMTGDVVRNLRENGVQLADSINGPHDAIALIQGDSPSDVAVLILNKVRKMDGVKDVTVYLVTEQELAK